MNIPSEWTGSLHEDNRYPGIATHVGVLARGGVELYVEHHVSDGADPAALPLLALHGVGGNTEQLWPEITNIACDRPVVTFDFRGHGRSSHPESYTLNDHVSDAVAVADAFALDRFAVLGYSMGSYVAPGVAAALPDRVREVVAVVSRLDGTVSGMVALMGRHAAELEGKSQEEAMAIVTGYLHSPATAQSTLDDIWAFMNQQNARPELALTPELFQRANTAIAGFDNAEAYSRLGVPVLVISGADDELNPPDEGAKVAAAVPDGLARLVIVPEAGHLLSFEKPREYTDLVREFLDSHDG